MKFIEAEVVIVYNEQSRWKGVRFYVTMLKPKVTFSFMYKTKQLFRKQT